MRWSPEQLARDCGGVLLRAGTRPVATAFIDSRTPRHDALFVPIVAARDGHAFIEAALEAGASANLQARGRPRPAGEGTVVEVEDTLVGLTDLARASRSRIEGPVVAITGSNGKTTTRALVQAVLAVAHDRVLSTRGNFNNHLGLPLTLLDEPHDPDAAVLELGMSAPGENDHLASVASPTVGIVTSIALEHLEFMGTLEAVAEAEAEVMPHVADGGALVMPASEPLLEGPLRRHLDGRRIEVFRVGSDERADLRILEVEVGERTRGVVAMPDGARVEFRLALFGAHNVQNAASALAVAHHLGLDRRRIIEAIEAVEPVGDRGRVVHWGSHRIVADCYNANPGSMEAALRSLAAFARHPRIAVLGDMLELGPDEARLHADVGTLAAGLGLDGLVGVGPRTEAMVSAARARGIEAVHVGDDIERAAAQVREWLADAEAGVVLLKASRGMRLERMLASLATGA